MDCKKASQTLDEPLNDTGSFSNESARGRRASGGESGGNTVQQDLPCRISLKARGLEWFIYNRSPAYDSILTSMSETTIASDRPGAYHVSSAPAHPQSLETSKDGKISSSSASGQDTDNTFEDKMSAVDGKSARKSFGYQPETHQDIQPQPLPEFLELLPIRVQCDRGAIVMGNENVRSVLVAKFDKADGQIDARSSGPLDINKQCFDFDFEHPVIQFRPNREYKESQKVAAEKAKPKDAKDRNTKNDTQRLTGLHRGKYKTFLSFWKRLAFLKNTADIAGGNGSFGRGVDDGTQGERKWLGLTRYLDETEALVEQERWKAVEYAKFETIVDSPKISLSFFWDVPGAVPFNNEERIPADPGFEDDINGGAPPDYGVDLRVYGGDLNYGPWADRQRADIQKFFFPTLYKDSSVVAALVPGQKRVSTIFKIIVEIEQQVTLRIPMREESKDSKWKHHLNQKSEIKPKSKAKKQTSKSGKAEISGISPETRPFGWLSVTVMPDSSVKYMMDMYGHPSGFRNHLQLDLKNPEMSSSVNHDILLRSSSQTISCDLSNPLSWNALRQWQFKINSDDLELFILRDHMFLLTDLVNDWTSGPSADFYTFVPFVYAIHLSFPNFKLYLNVNDSNIINNPSDIEDNTFIVIQGEQLATDLNIPLRNFQPSRNKVSFDVHGSHGGIQLRTPPWNTQHTFLDNHAVATLKTLKLNGSYNYCTSTSHSLTDTVLLSLHGVEPNVRLHGFLVRYFMKVKDNYFGEDLHFRTLEEYYDQLNKRDMTEPGDTDELPHSKPTNDLDVVLTVSADNACAMLPCNLYSGSKHIRIDITSIELDLRFTNYYMDMETSFSPLAISYAQPYNTEKALNATESRTELFVDGVSVYGHRLFGLPPTEPTYVCNWDFSVGSISGECSSSFLQSFALALRSFAFTFEDAENALPARNLQALHDVTFLRARIEPVRIWLHVEDVAFLVSMERVNLQYNDWAGPLFSERLHLVVPGLTFACVDGRTASRHRSGTHPKVITRAYVQTTIDLRMVEQKYRFKQDRLLQQEHVSQHDARTSRTGWLLDDPRQVPNAGTLEQRLRIKLPAMPFPSMPEPAFHSAASNTDGSSVLSEPLVSATARLANSRKSSFFSVHSERRSINPSTRVEKLGASSSNLNIRRRRDSASQSATSARPKPASKPSLWPLEKSTSQRNLPKDGKSPNFGLPRSSVAFSSSYEMPYFPLHKVYPDLDEVPALPDPIADDSEFLEFPSTDFDSLQDHDEGSAHVNFILHLRSGIRGFCTPVALHNISHTVSVLQAKDPVDVLDGLQFDSMSEFIRHRKEKTSPTKMTQLSVRLPFLRLRLLNKDEPGKLESVGHQCYDLSAEKMAVTLRSKSATFKQPEDEAKQLITTHVTFSQIGISAKAWLGGPSNDKASIHITFTDPLLWAVEDQALTGEFQFKDLEIICTDRKVEHLASLVNSTIVTSERLVRDGQTTANEQTSRLRYLLLFLTNSGAFAPDPLFLSGASHILRSAANHPRTGDTWKMLCRLRLIQQNLPEKTWRRLVETCSQGPIEYPDDTASQVTANFERWRAWDLANAGRSLLMRKVYGHMLDQVNRQFREPMIMKGSVGAKQIRLIIDPGPKENQFILDTLLVAIALNQPTKGSELKHNRDASRARTSTVEILCTETSIRLHWELCELVDDVLRQIRTLTSKSSQNSTSAQATKVVDDIHTFHVVLTSKTSLVSFDSINLRAMSLNRGFRGSLVLCTPQNHADKSTAKFLIHAEATTSEILHHSKVLYLSKLRRPSIYTSIEGRDSENGKVRVWKLAGSCKHLSMDVQEDLHGLLEIADTVLGDEFAYFRKLSRNFTFGGSEDGQVQSSKPDWRNEFHVALFLDVYNISISLLRSLTYNIAGSTARTSITPSSALDLPVTIDFDIKEHVHTVLAKTEESDHEISTLELPPINGRFVFSIQEQLISMSLYVSIEVIVLDASAVHGLLTTLNQSAIVNSCKSLSRDVELVKGHYEAILGSPKPSGYSSNATVKREMFYDARVVAAGLSVEANTPESDTGSAHLRFELGYVQLNATNRDHTSDNVLLHPEMGLDMQKIKVVLEQSDNIEFHPCGDISFAATFKGTSQPNDAGELARSYQLRSESLEINLYTETASVVIDILGYLQEKFKTLDLSREVRNLQKLRRFRARTGLDPPDTLLIDDSNRTDGTSTSLFTSMYSLELNDIQVSWKTRESFSKSPAREAEDLVLSFTKIELATRKENAARLRIENFQLQMAPDSQPKSERSANSALLPEVVFNVAYLSTAKERRMAFQAAGKTLDLRLTSRFIIPASELQHSMQLATQQGRKAIADWTATLPQGTNQTKNFLTNKRLASLLVDADFAGAVVFVQGSSVQDPQSATFNASSNDRTPHHNSYDRLSGTTSNSTTLRSPGLAFKVEFRDPGNSVPSLNAEIKVDASSNILYPTVVPIILEISSSVQEVVGEPDKAQQNTEEKASSQSRFLDEGTLRATDPAAILGNCTLNLGVRICRQEFSLSCQPIARVAASAKFEDIYVTINTVQSADRGRFFAISATFIGLQASVQHVYSRESTGSFEVESIFLSLMNSKHVTADKGLSAILKIRPIKAQINAKQLQDFLLFREIWSPPEAWESAPEPAPAPAPGSQAFAVQRYQQVASSTTFPWNATLSITELDVKLDLGQSLGKSSLVISNLWVSSRKSSDWEQNLCLGFDNIEVNSTGRMSGFVELKTFKVRTAIQWPWKEEARNQTPLVQASIGFDQLRVKAAFDYQAFLVADITTFEFLMYNVRNTHSIAGDRLVAILNGDKVQAFCTAASAAQGLALYQTFERLIQEKQASYKSSLSDIEKFLRRKSTADPLMRPVSQRKSPSEEKLTKTPIQLQTDVVVTLKAINIGVFSSTFFDNQLLKWEAFDTSARFAVVMESGRVHSGLGLTLGELSVSLAPVPRHNVSKTIAEVLVDDVVANATAAKGGTILKVPRVFATMQTWNMPNDNNIDFIFKSTFEGKVDIGWNYNRISFIRGMHASHMRALAKRLGKPLPQSALQITGGPQPEGQERGDKLAKGGQEKITAVVNVPQSRYQYNPLEPPIIETPQLRELGEATPPLEWIGLHRERMPNLTHQIVIVTLLEVAKEVEDAYSRILGSF